jgi:hypothetical protein
MRRERSRDVEHSWRSAFAVFAVFIPTRTCRRCLLSEMSKHADY